MASEDRAEEGPENPQVNHIPRVFLYGDSEQDSELDFLHCEAILTRSGANDWIIRPHSHPAHVQILFVSQEGGWLGIEAEQFQIEAPSLFVIPAGLVHEIRFRPHTDGFVITAATAYIAAIIRDDKRLADSVLKPAAFSLMAGEPDTRHLGEAFELLMREFIWNAPCRRTAVQAFLLQILVTLLRLRDDIEPGLASHQHRHYNLIVRFRQLVEEHFREEKNLTFFAGKLGVTTARLNAACRAMADTSAARLLHERLVIEAKRYLLYTGMSVTEISLALGFNDPAYFNRFFAQRVGCPPGAFREAAEDKNRIS